MSGDSSLGNEFAGFLKRNKERAGVITAVVTAIFALPKIVAVAKGNPTWSVISGVGLGWLYLLWIYTKKTENEKWEGIDQQPKIKKVYQFLRWRKWALAGMILLPTLTAGGLAIANYIERRPSNKTIILVADFQGPDQKYAVTQTVINRLRRATEDFPELEIKTLNLVITEQEGSVTAHDRGRENKASVVLWGFYDEALTGTVHIETLTEQRRLPSSYAIRSKGEQIDYSASVADKPSLTVRESMAGDMSLIILLLIGVIHYESNDYDEAIRRFSRALEQKTSSQMTDYQSDLLFFRGNSFSFKRDFDSAIADYDQAIKLKPDYTFAYNNRGNAYNDKGQYDRAIADYDQAIKLKPDFAFAYNNRGNTYYDKGQYDRAIADYDQAIKLKPDFAFVYNNRGVAYEGKGQYDRAIADHDQAIKLKPDYTFAYNNRGNAYKDKGQFDRAIADYDQAIKLNPDDAAAYYNRGNTYKDKGQYDRAIADYDQAIKLKPDFAAAYDNRGNVYYDKGQYDRAIADHDQAIKLKPDYAAAYYNRGNAYKDKGQYDRAIADYDQAIKLKPDYAVAYNNRGVAYRGKGQYDRAIADFDQAIKLKPDDPFAYNNRGATRYFNGQYDRAIADHDQAIKLKPDDARAYYFRGIAYENIGNKQIAIDDFRKSLELSTNPDDRKIALEKLRSLGVKTE